MRLQDGRLQNRPPAFSRVKNRKTVLADFVDENMALRAMTTC
jgi:hypothetical protein